MEEGTLVVENPILEIKAKPTRSPTVAAALKEYFTKLGHTLTTH